MAENPEVKDPFIALKESQEAQSDITRLRARQSGRLELALQVKSLLKGKVALQDMPGSEPLTEAEKAIYELVVGYAERMGATLDGK